MSINPFDSIDELLLLVGSVFGFTILTGLGIAAERAGIQNVLTGELVLGLWEVGVGVLAIYVGVYLLGYRKVWLRLRGSRTATSR